MSLDVVCDLQSVFLGNLVLVEHLQCRPIPGMRRSWTRISHLLYYVFSSEDLVGFTVRLNAASSCGSDIISVGMAGGAIGLEQGLSRISGISPFN